MISSGVFGVYGWFLLYWAISLFSAAVIASPCEAEGCVAPPECALIFCSAPQVCSPATPSTVSPFAPWNCFRADSVFSPKMPSTSRLYPAAFSAVCSCITPSPVSL